MRKIIIQIGLEFAFGPLLMDEEDENGNESTGVKFVDEDEIVRKIDKEVNELWCSLYHKDDSQPDGLRFDSKREKELAPVLLDGINNLIKRLEEINDGSYEIQDMITDYLKKMVSDK